MSRVALLIGVSEYSEPDLKPLASATEDIQAMQRALLRSSEFAADQIRVLANPQKQEVEEAIYWLFADRQKDDLLLFYFSGHGIKDETGKLYFSLPTTRKDRKGLVKHTAVPANLLHENMNDSRSTCQVLVLDCCFSGAFAKGLTIKDDGSVDIPTNLGGKGRAIFTSSNSIEYSFQQEGLTLSVYTHFFVEGLEKGAADLDGDGLISADELHDYVIAKVKTAAPAMTPQFFPVEQGHRIYLGRSAKDDPVLKYRKVVEQKVKQGSFQAAKDRFSVPARRTLEERVRQLGLTSDAVKAIEAEVLQPLREYQRKLQDYEQTLRDTLEDEPYPFDAVILLDLQDYQKLLGLRDEDIQKIEAEVLPDSASTQLSEPSAVDSPITQDQQASATVLLDSLLNQVGPFTDGIDGLQAATGVDLSRPQLITSEQAGAAQAYALRMKRAAENATKFYEAASYVAAYDQSSQLAFQQLPKLPIFKFEIITVDAKGKETNRRPGQAEFFAEDLGNGITLEMVKIPDGTFEMGSPKTEKDHLSTESPQHTVTVSSFFIGKFVVTQAQYQAIMGNNPATFKGDKRPVVQVSWNAAIEFCKKLSDRTGRTYRLPSEAEWEYACRAGTTTPFHFGETITGALANYNASVVYRSEPKGKYRQQTTEVGTFPPNAFGLYDMHGNVWEWCADHWHENYQGAPIDGSAWLTSDQNAQRLMRGGSWDYDSAFCRSAYRDSYDPGLRDHDLGFRVVCVLA